MNLPCQCAICKAPIDAFEPHYVVTSVRVQPGEETRAFPNAVMDICDDCQVKLLGLFVYDTYELRETK